MRREPDLWDNLKAMGQACPSLPRTPYTHPLTVSTSGMCRSVITMGQPCLSGPEKAQLL